MEDKPTHPHIAILPSPGMGHLIPLCEFAKRIVLHHDCSATVIALAADSSSKAQNAVLDGLPKNINSIQLPPIPLDDVPKDAKIETRISLTVKRSLGLIRDVLKKLASTHRLVALVVDLFATDAFDLAKEFGISPYIFYPTTLTVLSVFINLPILDETVSCEYRDLSEPIRLPGCIPLHGKDLLDPVQDRQNDAYRWLLHHCKRYKEARGILVNSFVDVEPGPARALMEAGQPPVYPVGPLIQTGSAGGVDENECLRWLDEQPRGSVLYVSFGSGGTLTSHQLSELALGLEMSGQRFLWVARSPQDKVANAAYFSVQSIEDPLDFLPEGFLARTKGLGLVVPSWAPQIQVLAHGSTGGFLTHCGWNSTLESIVHGVPLIAWPLYAEQKMNAVMLADGLKVALRPRAGEDGVIRKEEIATVVRGLMEGEGGREVRNRMHDLKDAAARVIVEGGSSQMALSQVAHQWKNPKQL
ncbi:hydroquinone glucosyltransferase-like [Magnolia sinica]|uniref:hydroquinone glucosyltransferase-like n=1 Tax=Magnolia sinica TaxID=86752 RepID=UPI0026596E57|nr:hydroquinone glucosyltransferase-like [Magnolia sinica]